VDTDLPDLSGRQGFTQKFVVNLFKLTSSFEIELISNSKLQRSRSCCNSRWAYFYHKNQAR